MNLDAFRDRKLILVADECFGVTFSHWTKRWQSWSLQWQDVVAIDAVQIEPADLGFVFVNARGRPRIVLETMEHWDALVDNIRRRFPGFDWSKIEIARRSIDMRYSCWSTKNELTSQSEGQLPAR